MKFIKTTDDQFINTRYISKVFCNFNPQTSQWYVMCKLDNDRQLKTIYIKIKDRQTALKLVRLVVNSIGQELNLTENSKVPTMSELMGPPC